MDVVRTLAYYIPMTQPKTPPISIRPGNERLMRIDAYAEEHNLSRHLAILLMLDEGYRSLSAPAEAAVPKPPSGGSAVKPTPVQQVEVVHVSVPVFERKAFNPRPKSGK